MWKRRATPPAARRESPRTADKTSPWHAVSIGSRRGMCRAAVDLNGSRFLSREAPRLPLEACGNTVDCVCYYQHHDDRRGHPRRAGEVPGLHHQGYTGQERRRERGRRRTDLNNQVDWHG